ncbi:HEPN domain-containing protein [Bacillus sp. AFS088145]|uniref:ApeA N-terminal domain 1-containing protein n=1 Tax=Bacillus sp. AFS088145 TaxID=2033514 RepID=UPI000BF67881|nr:HEPN domain-containing protein [Bacillus sp. AFS088145]PFH86471.1 hypothetical protein COI44_12695 [Bacillus sp. AFS088145]
MAKKTKDMTMYDEFEFRGYWWVPDSPEKQVAGILTYNLEGINLELFGDLGEEQSFFGNKAKKYQLVLGTTEDGEDITLYDGFQTKFKISGYVTTKLTFNRMLVGKHFHSKEEMKFHSISINYSYLEEWMGYDPFEDEIEAVDGIVSKLGVTYTFPPVFEIKVNSKDTTVKAGYNVNKSGELFKSKVFQHTGTLDIIPNEYKELDWFLDFTIELQDFLTFLLNREVYPKKLTAKGELFGEVKNAREKIYIYLIPMKDFYEKSIKADELFIHYKMIKDNLETLLNNWFEDDSYSSRKIYLRNIYGTKVDWETKFLNYAKSMESFHRDTAGDAGQFLSDEEYEKVKNHMIEALPTDIEPDIRNKLISTLKYAHHHGFERRIRDTFKDMNQQMVGLIFKEIKNLKGFATDVRTTRDYYTHFGEKPDYYFKDWGLYFANIRMQIILFYHFSRRLGISEDTLNHSVQQDYGLVNLLDSAKQELKN